MQNLFVLRIVQSVAGNFHFRFTCVPVFIHGIASSQDQGRENHYLAIKKKP